MVVNKNAQSGTHKSKLTVDNWQVKHSHNIVSGENELVEKYMGEEEMGITNTHKYLGFVLSNTGDNLVNISAMKKISICIIRKTRLISNCSKN